MNQSTASADTSSFTVTGVVPPFHLVYLNKLGRITKILSNSKTKNPETLYVENSHSVLPTPALASSYQQIATSYDLNKIGEVYAAKLAISQKRPSYSIWQNGQRIVSQLLIRTKLIF